MHCVKRTRKYPSQPYQVISCIIRLKTYSIVRCTLRAGAVRRARNIKAKYCRIWRSLARARCSQVSRSSDAVQQRLFREYAGSEGSLMTFDYPATLVRRRAFISCPQEAYGSPNVPSKSTKDLLWNPDSNGRMVKVPYGLAQTASLVQVLDVDLDLVWRAFLTSWVQTFGPSCPDGEGAVIRMRVPSRTWDTHR